MNVIFVKVVILNENINNTQIFRKEKKEIDIIAYLNIFMKNDYLIKFLCDFDLSVKKKMKKK